MDKCFVSSNNYTVISRALYCIHNCEENMVFNSVAHIDGLGWLSRGLTHCQQVTVDYSSPGHRNNMSEKRKAHLDGLKLEKKKVTSTGQSQNLNK